MKYIWITLTTLLIAGMAQAQTAMGTLQVNGQPGKFQIFQKVKAVRCNIEKRGECSAAIFFNLNTPQTVEAGTYIVGFENTINPNLVTVSAGGVTNLNLERLTVPAAIKGQKIRIFRDFTASVEQRKIMTAMFYMNRHFFRLEKENFGDLYLTSAWDRDFVQRFTYEICGNISAYGEPTPGANRTCKAWNNAKRPSDLEPLFIFKDKGLLDGRIIENWVSIPGDVIPSVHPRYLVSAPLTDQDFVSVFAGVYRIQAEGESEATVTVKIGNL